MKRREILKGFATLPLLGIFGIPAGRALKKAPAATLNQPDLPDLGETILPRIKDPGSRELRIGIIGWGGRGHYLARALGFAHPDWMKRAKERGQLNAHDTTFDFFMRQENLNVRITGISDVYDPRAESGMLVSASQDGPGALPGLKEARRYQTYQEMLESDEIDAVVIATTDHWHARMAIDAAKAGKHIYLEKPMAQTEEETHELSRVISDSDIIFQLGHQNHQVDTHIKARKLVDDGFLGHISLIQGTFNRWRRPGNPRSGDFSEQNLDWEQFQGPAPSRVPFDPDRFRNWTYYFDYSLGQFGQLFCHEYAAINQITGIGIPGSVVSTGGNYVWYRDRYETPNVFSIACDYPDKELVLDFSLTLGNAMTRQRLFMGTEASMQVDAGLKVWPELSAEKFREFSLIPGEPLINYAGGEQLDAVSSATAGSFASKGIHNMWIGGRLVNTTHLHMIDWLNCIRHGGTPKCNIDLGVEEAITIIMAARSYREKRRVEWDPVSKKIV